MLGFNNMVAQQDQKAVNLSHLLQSPPCILGSSVCTFISTTTGTAGAVTMMRLLLCLTLLMSVLTVTVLTAEDNDHEEAARATTYENWRPTACTPGCLCPEQNPGSKGDNLKQGMNAS
ncbi:hypothetical protein ACOMHN_050064 [Nucella lapillus]